MSQASAIPNPPPYAAPLTAAITCQRIPDRGNSVPPPASGGLGSLKSRPEQNPRPAPKAR